MKEKLYVVYVENTGFVDTFSFIDGSFTTTLNYEHSDYSTNKDDAERIAEMVKGVVLETWI